jgi:hypothetical protein
MPDVLEEVLYTLGDAVVAPGVGHAELILAFLVTLAFTAMAVMTWLGRGTDPDRRQPRF